jgi:hypothetical protein
MPFNTTTASRTLGNILNQIPVTFTYSGKEYTGTRTNISKDRLFSQYGFKEEKYNFSILVNLSSLDSEPKKDQLITVGSIEHRILDTDTDAIDASIIIHLGGKYG